MKDEVLKPIKGKRQVNMKLHRYISEMKDEWYADKRDIVKWGSIVSIARKKGIRKIIQVALYRPEKNTANISIEDGKKTFLTEFPTEVWDHFRNIEDICRLEKKGNLKIIVHKETFQWDKSDNRFKSNEEFRLRYFDNLCSKIKRISENKIVFLDPDTGIDPNKSAKFEHVKTKEIEQVYKSLNPNDILIFYQHARRDNGWREKTKNEFKQAINTINEIQIYYSEDIAKDVALFVVERT